MIDVFSILVSTLLTLYVIVRAAKLDRTRPWFQSRREWDREQEELARKAKIGKPTLASTIAAHRSAVRPAPPVPPARPVPPLRR